MSNIKNIVISIGLVVVAVLFIGNAPREVLMILPELLVSAPELVVLFDLVALELVISFLVLYFKPLYLKLQTIQQRIKQESSICVSAMRSSALLQPKVYLTHALFCCCGTVVFGSVVYASILLAPIMLLNQHFH